MKEIGLNLSLKIESPPIGSQIYTAKIMELEKLALNNNPIPKNMTLPEIGYFYTVKIIGKQYYSGKLHESDAYILLVKYANELYSYLDKSETL